MSKIFTSHVPANELMPEDRFKMGGQMYRVVGTDTNMYGDIIISSTPWNALTRRDLNRLIVPNKTMFKVYNQE